MTPEDRRPRVDVAALDGRGSWQEVPVAFDPARIRNFRKGQIVLVGFRHSYSNSPIVLGHFYNLEAPTGPKDAAGAAVSNLVPEQYANVDDDVTYHFETNAFIRIRNANATPLQGGRTPDGTPFGAPSPAIAEITLNSGATLVMTENAEGQCSVEFAMPSGASIEIDANGVITSTTGSVSTTLNPTTQQATTQAATGVKTIVDGAGNAISTVALSIGLGDLSSNLPASAAAINEFHLQNTVNALRTQARQDVLAAFTAMVAAGVPNASGCAAQLAALAGVTVPDASSVVKIKS
jgi:hypothetical protein